MAGLISHLLRKIVSLLPGSKYIRGGHEFKRDRRQEMFRARNDLILRNDL